MRNLVNVIKETKNAAVNNNKAYDFADGHDTLSVGTLNAKLVNNLICTDENGMKYKEYCVFKLGPAIKEALTVVVREIITGTIRHDVIIRGIETTGTICNWEGTRRNVPLLITIQYDPISHCRVLYVNDPTSKQIPEEKEIPAMGVALRMSLSHDRAGLLCRLSEK